MAIVYFLLPASLLLGVIALGAYLWAVRAGQFDDLETPSLRVLEDDNRGSIEEKIKTRKSQ